MPSIITHPVVAAGLSPAFSRRGVTLGVVCLGALCTIVPDLDVIGFRYGIPYDAPLGHRGFSHSLVFAAALALLLTLVRRLVRTRRAGLAVFLFLFLCTASHGVLDALTDGGRGIAFFAPFSNERYFFPWRPISVSPLSVSRFLSSRATTVLRSELIWVVMPWVTFGLAAWLIHGKPHRRSLRTSLRACSKTMR